MASLTFSTPNGLNYGNGDVTVELTGGPSFTIYDIVISGNSSWTFDIDDPFYGAYGVNPDIHHFNGTYTFNFDNGCTSVHQINVPQFTENPCPDNCKEYQVENNYEETVFYYSDCETGEVQEITMYQGFIGLFCICDGEYYDPSGKLNITERGPCLSDFNCDITIANLTGEAIEGQDVLSNVMITNEGNPILATSATPSQFQAGVNAYDITYVIPSDYGNSGETCNIRIVVSVTTTTTTTPPPPSECGCVKIQVTYTGRDDRANYTYADCEGNTRFGSINKGETQIVCMCEFVPPTVPGLRYEEIGVCGPSDGLY